MNTILFKLINLCDAICVCRLLPLPLDGQIHPMRSMVVPAALVQLLLMWKLHNVLGINILGTHHIHPQLCGWVSAGAKQCVNTCEWWNKQLEFIPKYISLWREHKKLSIIGCIVLISSNNPGICDPFFFITWWSKTKLTSIPNWGGFSVVVVAQVVFADVTNFLPSCTAVFLSYEATVN